MDLLQPGDVAHVHFQDVPDMPRELLDNTTRLIPGDGITPKTKILKKLVEKGYSGPASVELFLPEFQQGDPYEVASKIRTKAEAVLHQAKVQTRHHQRSGQPDGHHQDEGAEMAVENFSSSSSVFEALALKRSLGRGERIVGCAALVSSTCGRARPATRAQPAHRRGSGDPSRQSSALQTRQRIADAGISAAPRIPARKCALTLVSNPCD